MSKTTGEGSKMCCRGFIVAGVLGQALIWLDRGEGTEWVYLTATNAIFLLAAIPLAILATRRGD